MTSVLDCGHVVAYLRGEPHKIDGQCPTCWERQNREDLDRVLRMRGDLNVALLTAKRNTEKLHAAKLRQMRDEYRSAQRWFLADLLRDQLRELGEEVGDHAAA